MPRTYTEREIAALLARAAERQTAAPEERPSVGLTLDEIARIAGEAGLDPAHLRTAAAELDADAPHSLRAPGALVLERWIDAPLTDMAWEEAVAALRLRFGASAPSRLGPTGPDTSRVGAAHEWTHSGLLTTTVTVSPRGGRTRVRLTQTEGLAFSDAATARIWAGLASVALALMAAFAVIGADAGPLALAVLPTLVLVAGTLGGGALFTPLVRRNRARRAAKAADALDFVVGAMAAALPEPAAYHGAPAASAVPSDPRLDLDALPDAPDSAEPRLDRRRVS